MVTSFDMDTLARTIYGEAEANNLADAAAVADVIWNRKKNGKQWPNTLAEVCLQPWQFSCWNTNDPNRNRILNAKGPWFDNCVAIARKVVELEGFGVTNGATHYYATWIKAPKWAKGHTPCYRIAHKNGHEHLFFNDIDTSAPVNASEALEQVRPLNKTGTIAAAQVGVAGAATVGILSESVNQLAPAFPLAQTLISASPWVIVAITLSAIAFMAYRRIMDRAEGNR